MKTLFDYINEAKHIGKKLHFFTRETDKDIEGIYVDAADEAAARKKFEKHIKSLGDKAGQTHYIGLELYDRKGKIL